MKKQRRKAVVFASLLAAVSLTSAGLQLLSPAPLTPHVSAAIEIDAFEPVYNTQSPFAPGQWKYIYVHHSKTAGGDGNTIRGDHFLVGNGEGCGDGEIQMTGLWSQQNSARPVGANIDRACISICVVGDFNHATPTPAQLRRLAELVRSLQTRCDIAGEDVIVHDQITSSAGIGSFFPLSHFRQQLVR